MTQLFLIPLLKHRHKELDFNTCAVRIPRDYSAGVGRFLGCFHPTATQPRMFK